jgi:hypothetical protein
MVQGAADDEGGRVEKPLVVSIITANVTRRKINIRLAIIMMWISSQTPRNLQ